MSASSSLPPGPPPENTDSLRERLNKTTAAYSRFVPREFLHLLGIDDIRKVELGQQVERKMTILFCDIRNFTALSETMSPQENFNFLNSYLVQMEPVIARAAPALQIFAVALSVLVLSGLVVLGRALTDIGHALAEHLGAVGPWIERALTALAG